MRFRHQPLRRMHVPKAGADTRSMCIGGAEDSVGVDVGRHARATRAAWPRNVASLAWGVQHNVMDVDHIAGASFSRAGLPAGGVSPRRVV